MRPEERTTFLIWLVLSSIVLVPALSAASNEATCANRITSCNSSLQYFPTQVRFEHASSVTALEYYNTYVVVNMSWKAWSGVHQQTLVLVRCGCPSPKAAELLGNVKILFVPVSTVFIEETVAVPKLYLIGQRNKVNSVASATYVTTMELREDVENGMVTDIANNYTKLMSLSSGLPDLFLTGSGSTSWKSGWTNAMTERQVLDSDAGEQTPLGRAELIKLTGLFTGAEDAANTIFSMVQSRYADAMRIAASESRQRPSVLLGVPFGSWGWSLTRGTSYVGQLLRDAQADYRNADDHLNQAIGSLNATTAVQYFGQADYWVNAYYVQPDGTPFTMDTLAAGNETLTPQGDRAVFSQLVSFQCDRVLSNAKVVSPGLKGYPIIELGVVRPDLILLDLVYYLHPAVRNTSAIFATYVPTFYEMLKPLSNRTGVPACPGPLLQSTPSRGSAYLTASWNIKHVDQFSVRDQIYPLVKNKLSDSLRISLSRFDILISGGTFNDSEAPFSFRVNVDTPTCSACSGDEGPCDVALARRLNSFAPELQAILQSVVGSKAVRAEDAVDTATPKHSLICSNGVVIPLKDVPGVVESSEKSMSKSTIIGISVGSVLGFLVVAVILGVVAFRTGHRRGYGALLSQQQQLPTEMKSPTA